MALNREIETDFWVRDLLKDAKIELDPQGSNIEEINQALKTASKKGTKKTGKPEFVGVVKDFLLVIENKADLNKHRKTIDNAISTEIKDIQNYAVNGALFYGQHLVKKTTYKKAFVFGISGNEKRHYISPIYINEEGYYKELREVKSFISFGEENINNYYKKEVLNEETSEEKTLIEVLRQAKTLHEDLRNYGNVTDANKPLIVSGLLLALMETEFGNFSIENLRGDKVSTDGKKIYTAIESNLKRAEVGPEDKKSKILSQFLVIQDSQKLNDIDLRLNKTPLKHYIEFLNKNLYQVIKKGSSSEDYLGRFYGEFMSYSGGDGQSLGIVLTPKHIADLFCDLVKATPKDIVFDPCTGTAGLLIAFMHNMISQTDNEDEINDIKKNKLHGFELQEYMFTVATTNMILRGDGKSNLGNIDFIKEPFKKIKDIKRPTVGVMNPPYSQGSKKNPHLYEISFLEHLLDSLEEGGRAAVIVPQSTFTGKTNEEKNRKINILKKHTLKGVITLHKDTFYGVGVVPCIAVFEAGIPHDKESRCKFIDFTDDGYEVSKHIGLLETERAKDRKEHLLNVWFDKVDAESKFCVKTTIEAEDEWLHSFYYFNDDIPTEADFEKTIADYLSFEFSMIMQNRGYLFGVEDEA